MDEYVFAVLSATTDAYSYLDRGRLEAFVYMAQYDCDSSVEEFTHNRFGVTSDTLNARLHTLAEEDQIVEDIRYTFGHEKRYYYRVNEDISYTVSSAIEEVVESLISEYEEIPVSNLHSIVGEHDW